MTKRKKGNRVKFNDRIFPKILIWLKTKVLGSLMKYYEVLDKWWKKILVNKFNQWTWVWDWDGTLLDRNSKKVRWNFKKINMWQQKNLGELSISVSKPFRSCPDGILFVSFKYFGWNSSVGNQVFSSKVSSKRVRNTSHCLGTQISSHIIHSPFQCFTQFPSLFAQK